MVEWPVGGFGLLFFQESSVENDYTSDLSDDTGDLDILAFSCYRLQNLILTSSKPDPSQLKV